MVTGEAADEAVRLARANPGLSVGIHIVLVDGRSALPRSRVPHLVDENGWFRSSPVRAGLAAQFPPLATSEVRQEVRAQFELFRETGLTLSHADGHHHLHLHPVVLDTFAALAREFEIPVVRLPSEELAFALAHDRSRMPGKALESWVFTWLRRHGERVLGPAGIAFDDRVYGLHQTGRLDESYLLDLIPRIEADAVEIYAHPEIPADAERGDGRSGAGARELAALTSPTVRAVIEAAGFTLGRSLPVAAAGDGGTGPLEAESLVV
jgi:hopanoid biosynthesis associated protein HpnK